MYITAVQTVRTFIAFGSIFQQFKWKRPT